MHGFSDLFVEAPFYHQTKLEELLIITETQLEEDLPLGDVPQQQLHGDAQLGHVLLESIGRVLGSFSGTLNQIFVGLGVVQLYRLDTSLIIVEPATTKCQNPYYYPQLALLGGR